MDTINRPNPEMSTIGKDHLTMKIETTFRCLSIEGYKLADLSAILGNELIAIRTAFEKAIDKEFDPGKDRMTNFLIVIDRVIRAADKFMLSPVTVGIELIAEVADLARIFEGSKKGLPECLTAEIEALEATINEIVVRIEPEMLKNFDLKQPLIFPRTESYINPSFSRNDIVKNDTAGQEDITVGLAPWDRRLFPCETTRLIRSPKLMFVNEYLSTSFNPPKWKGPELGGSYEDFFVDIYEPYIATRLLDSVDSYINAIFYSFERKKDREKYREKFIGRPVIAPRGGNWLRQLLRMVAVLVDLENIQGYNDLKKKFYEAEKQQKDETMLEFIDRLRSILQKWRGIDCLDKASNRRKLIEEVVMKTSCPTWQARFGNNTKFENFNVITGTGSDDLGRFIYLINYYSQYDMSKIHDGPLINKSSRSSMKIYTLNEGVIDHTYDNTIMDNQERTVITAAAPPRIQGEDKWWRVSYGWNLDKICLRNGIKDIMGRAKSNVVKRLRANNLKGEKISILIKMLQEESEVTEQKQQHSGLNQSENIVRNLKVKDNIRPTENIGAYQLRRIALGNDTNENYSGKEMKIVGNTVSEKEVERKTSPAKSVDSTIGEVHQDMTGIAAKKAKALDPTIESNNTRNRNEPTTRDFRKLIPLIMAILSNMKNRSSEVIREVCKLKDFNMIIEATRDERKIDEIDMNMTSHIIDENYGDKEIYESNGRLITNETKITRSTDHLQHGMTWQHPTKEQESCGDYRFLASHELNSYNLVEDRNWGSMKVQRASERDWDRLCTNT